MNSIVVKKIIETGTRHEFWKILLTFELRVFFNIVTLARKIDTSKNGLWEFLSKSLWWSTFSLKESKSL